MLLIQGDDSLEIKHKHSFGNDRKVMFKYKSRNNFINEGPYGSVCASEHTLVTMKCRWICTTEVIRTSVTLYKLFLFFFILK